MTYIKRSEHELIDPHVENLSFEITTSGQLNYAITRLVLKWIARNLSYSRLAEAIGSMKLSMAEIERRVVHSYENTKIWQNGDVLEIAELNSQMLSASATPARLAPVAAETEQGSIPPSSSSAL